MENYGWLFEIGEVVESVFTKREIEEPFMSRNQKIQIIERHLQQCPGGIQRHYTCRVGGTVGETSKEYFRFNEIELRKIVSA